MGFFVGLTRQLNPDLNARLGARLHGGSVFRGRTVQEVKANLVQSRSTKICGSVRVKGNGCVGVNVVLRPKRRLELANRLQCFLEVQHRVAPGDAGSRGVHGVPFLNDLVPRCATAFVSKHVGRLTTVLRKRAVITTPVALTGDKEHQLAALLTLDTPLSLTLFGGQDFGGHRQTSHHAPSVVVFASWSNQR